LLWWSAALGFLLVRYRRLPFVFGTLFVFIPFLDLAPELADAAANSLSDISNSRRAEENDDDCKNNQQLRSAKTLEHKHLYFPPSLRLALRRDSYNLFGATFGAALNGEHQDKKDDSCHYAYKRQ
jgi:hypothetical protein